MNFIAGHRPRRLSCVLLAAALAGMVAGSGTANAETAEALDVTGYDLTLEHQPGAQTLRGTAVISAKARSALDRVTVRLAGLRATAVTVDSVPVKSFAHNADDELLIQPATTIRPGAGFRLRVEYGGTPGPGWLATTTGGANAFLGSSRSWFPVRDQARDKAEFRLAMTVPDGWGVVSVGREGQQQAGAGSTTFHWAEPEVDPDHVSVSIDRFTTERGALADGTPVITAYAPGLQTATKPLADRLPEVLDFLSAKFGRYPFDAAGNVFLQVSDGAPATSPQTRPVYLGAGNPQYMTLETVVHEQAHQWYGISAAPRLPADSCLSECFASYAPWLWQEAKEGADLDLRYRQIVAAKRGEPAFWERLYQPGVTPGITMYNKGPLALHALRRQLGEQAFDQLLRRWPQEHRASYADWPKFEALAAEVSGQNLDGFFAAWFRGATVPADEYLWPGPLKP
ncbi:M1 family metallopeptidase [Crossiella sp. S99.2]|uniref:M1 family metallopeptidase n=1 Tax=Crossiella sp. S99.2 TaxID=2936272 RepID=UPI001FFFC034|nr:M1 family metallopeptidase [Crossiella sp. S99.2]MCK2244429.1 M1 family metallopeptidase [Crossiella sp. S99.2]